MFESTTNAFKQESGVDESVTNKFPGSTVVHGSAASGAGDNRDIPEEEGGGIDPRTGQNFKARDFEGPGGPEEKRRMEAELNPGADHVRILRPIVYQDVLELS